MEYGDLETEWVLSQNPDVIVGRAMGPGIRPYENENDSLLQKYAQDIKALPGFDNVKAVKDDRVYIITNDYAVTPNYPSALMLLAKWFYPDEFSDLDRVVETIQALGHRTEKLPADDLLRPTGVLLTSRGLAA